MCVTSVFLSCSKDKLHEEPENITVNYLHISHTRRDTNPSMDQTIEAINYSKYDMLWLGGDLAQATSWDDETIHHADSIFNLSSPNTLWSLGNHDYDSLQRVRAVTNRNTYYAYYKNGICIVVLDTQDSLSNIIGAQKTFFENVVDTIQESSHLIILTHQLIWMYGNPDLEPQIPTVTNGGFGTCFFCINPNNFYPDIYPKLLSVKQKGIEVICIGGDIGFHVKEFSYVNSDGISFLASGIYYADSGNKGLLFTHDVTNRNLSWKFVLIPEL